MPSTVQTTTSGSLSASYTRTLTNATAPLLPCNTAGSGHVIVGARFGASRFGTPIVRRVTPGRALTASAGVNPIPLVGTLKSDVPAEEPDNTALLGCSRSSFKAMERETHSSPAARDPLKDNAGMTVERPMFPGHASGRSIQKVPEPMPDDGSTSNV